MKTMEHPTLLIFTPEGEIVGSQQGGMNADVIDAYRAQGEDAAFFSRPTLDFHDVYVHNGNKLRPRQPLRARIDKTVIRAGGEDAAKIVGVPAGARLCLSDGVTIINDIADGKTIRIRSPIPARWVIEIDAPPAHLRQTFIVIAE